jgi:hypothetical protein
MSFLFLLFIFSNQPLTDAQLEEVIRKSEPEFRKIEQRTLVDPKFRRQQYALLAIELEQTLTAPKNINAAKLFFTYEKDSLTSISANITTTDNLNLPSQAERGIKNFIKLAYKNQDPLVTIKYAQNKK